MRPDAYEAALADVGEAQEVEGYGMVKQAVGFSGDAVTAKVWLCPPEPDM